MKIFNLLIFSLFFLGMSSCSSDDASPQVTDEQALFGVWNKIDYRLTGESVYNPGNGLVVQTFETELNNLSGTLTFNNNPKTFLSTGTYDVTVTNNVLNRNWIDETVYEDILSNGEWTLQDDKITLSTENELGDDVYLVYTISELTNESLKINGIYREQFFVEDMLVTTDIKFYHEYSK